MRPLMFGVVVTPLMREQPTRAGSRCTTPSVRLSNSMILRVASRARRTPEPTQAGGIGLEQEWPRTLATTPLDLPSTAGCQACHHEPTLQRSSWRMCLGASSRADEMATPARRIPTDLAVPPPFRLARSMTASRMNIRQLREKLARDAVWLACSGIGSMGRRCYHNCRISMPVPTHSSLLGKQGRSPCGNPSSESGKSSTRCGCHRQTTRDGECNAPK